MSTMLWLKSRETGRFVRMDEKDLKKTEHKDPFTKHITFKQKAKKKETEFVGVSFCPRSGKWRAYIGVNGEVIRLGVYDSDYAAAVARDKAAIKYGKPTNILKKIA